MRCIFHGLTESRFRDTRNLKTTTNLTEKNDHVLQNNMYVNPVDGWTIQFSCLFLQYRAMVQHGFPPQDFEPGTQPAFQNLSLGLLCTQWL